MSPRWRGGLRRGLWGIAIGTLAVLTACGGDGNGGGQAPPPPTSQVTSYGFEPYLQQLVQQATCKQSTPVATNVNFLFAADQDTAEPRDLSKLSPSCK